MTPDEEVAALRKENLILRGIVAKLDGTCLHCGLVDKSRCASGFPGCAWADDLLCGEEEARRALVERAVRRAWDAGHIAGREKSPTMKENRELREMLEQAEARVAALERRP